MRVISKNICYSASPMLDPHATTMNITEHPLVFCTQHSPYLPPAPMRVIPSMIPPPLPPYPFDLPLGAFNPDPGAGIPEYFPAVGFCNMLIGRGRLVVVGPGLGPVILFRLNLFGLAMAAAELGRPLPSSLRGGLTGWVGCRTAARCSSCWVLIARNKSTWATRSPFSTLSCSTSLRRASVSLDKEST